MSIKSTVTLLLICIFLSLSYKAIAHNVFDDEHYEYKQKLILIQGKNSSVMKGEATPIYNFNKK